MAEVGVQRPGRSRLEKVLADGRPTALRPLYLICKAGAKGKHLPSGTLKGFVRSFVRQAK